MRRPTALLVAVTVSVAVMSLSACSSAPQSASIALPIAGMANPTRTATGGHRLQPANSTRRVVYVADISNNEVDLLQYHTWVKTGTITSGINNPSAVWVDRAGNLYVANYNPTSIAEYNVSGNLIFTYNVGIQGPAAITTDQYGTVFEADAISNSVVEFPQGVNSPAISCQTGGVDQNEGVAVDGRGNVFVANGSNIIEYKRGLISSHCNGRVLPITFSFVAGIALDTHNNLIGCDYNAPAVDIIAPPYTSITGTLGSGWKHPRYVTIDKAGTQAYVTDFSGNGSGSSLDILTYPAGSIVAQLTSANGIGVPESAVDSSNYVP